MRWWIVSALLLVTSTGLAQEVQADSEDSGRVDDRAPSGDESPAREEGSALPVAPAEEDESAPAASTTDAPEAPDGATEAVTSEVVSPASEVEPEDEAAPVADTGIRGRIVDSRSGDGLPDAVVIARSPRVVESAVTDENGGYVLVVRPGRYSVLAYTSFYHGARMPEVRVRRARFTDLELTLDAMDAEAIAEEVEIVYRADTSSALAQDQLRAAASGIGEGLGARQMSASGAGDAGAAARNVAGVALDGATLNIRGLGGRYTLVLLNGAALPSTDPDASTVDLDLFPSSVIDNLQVAKAFQPNLPGNFAGGVLDIRTVRFPREFTFQIGASTGFDSLSIMRDQLTYQGGDLDWLGFDDGSRAFPQGLDERIAVTRSGTYQSFQAVEEAAERFPNRWAFARRLGMPSVGLSGVIGDSIDVGGGSRLGYLLTADYSYAQLRRTGSTSPRPTIGEDGELQSFNDYEVERGIEAPRLSSLGTLSLELGPDDVLSYVSLFNHTADDETQRQVGYSGELAGAVERWQMQMVTRTTWFNQLRGDHRNVFGSRWRLRWSLFGSYGSRNEPDRRSVTYGPQGSLTRWLEKSQSGERFYSQLSQYDVGGTVDLRFPLWASAFGSFGLSLRDTERDFLNRRLRMLQDPSNTDQAAYTAPVEDLFGAQGIGSLTRMQEFTRDTDSYAASQRYLAGYLMLETPLFDDLSFSGGARLEVFQQDVRSFSPFASERGEDAVSGTTRLDVDVLPAASLRLALADRMNLRAAYGMTVARPQVRELAPYQYFDFIRDRNISGNPELDRTLIQNADLRWEWFFDEGELIALSAFYKYFDRPIELQIRNQMTYDSQYINAQLAHNVGGELELRFNFRHIHEALDVLSFNGNFTLMWSTVELPDELSGAVASQRALVGQSPFVANLSLLFDEPETGLSAALVYNLTGPRITDVGTRVGETLLPNVERDAFHQLDLILGWRVSEQLQLRVKLRNLLMQSQSFRQGSFLTQRDNIGLSGSLGLSFTP